MRRNTAGQTVSAMLVSKTDGSAITTGTTTVYVTGDAGTQAAGSVGSGAATHEGNGLWSYAPAQAETNYANVCFTFVNSSAVNANIQVYTLAYDASGQITVGALANDTITSSAVAASAVTEIQSGLSTLDAAGVRTAVGLASANLDTQLSTIDDFLDTEVTAIKAKTDLIPAAPASTTNITSASGITLATGGIGSGDIDSTSLNEIADAVLDRVLSAGSDSGADNTTSRTVRQALRSLRNRVNNSAGTLTVYKEDDTTASWTAATTQTAGDPISQINPT